MTIGLSLQLELREIIGYRFTTTYDPEKNLKTRGVYTISTGSREVLKFEKGDNELGVNTVTVVFVICRNGFNDGRPIYRRTDISDQRSAGDSHSEPYSIPRHGRHIHQSRISLPDYLHCSTAEKRGEICDRIGTRLLFLPSTDWKSDMEVDVSRYRRWSTEQKTQARLIAHQLLP